MSQQIGLSVATAVLKARLPGSASASRASEETITNQIQMLFASYRRADYDDPDGFIASMGMVLSQYPEDVVIYVTRPETGIQRRIKFPPTIPEIVEACDQRVAELARHQRFQNWGKENDVLAIEDRSPRPSMEDLKAKYGPDWGLTLEEPKQAAAKPSAPSVEQIVEHYKHHGLGFAPKSPPKSDEAAA